MTDWGDGMFERRPAKGLEVVGIPSLIRPSAGDPPLRNRPQP